MATVTMLEQIVESELPVSEESPFEVIDGQAIERPEMGAYPTEIATILASYLAPYARQGEFGRVIVEILIRIDSKTQYRPDLSFVSYDQWPKTRRLPDTDPWEIIPDLAIEVISKNDQASAVLAKVHHYFQAGVKAVWLVYPKLEIIHLYSSFTQIHVLTREDSLRGGDIIPGFQLPLSSLFEVAEEEADTTD